MSLRFKRLNEDEATVTVAPGHTIERAMEWRRNGGVIPVFRCSCGWSKSSAYDRTNHAAERHAEEVKS
jgi:hypothetical protein